jgi:hypothetical protein
MSELSYTYTIKLAAYFNQPLEFGEQGDIHPRVEAVRKFLDKMPDADLEPFYQRIVKGLDHFPFASDISEEYNGFTESRRKFVPDYKANIPMLEDLRVDGEPLQKLPDNDASVTLDSMHNDSRVMDFKSFIRKYGFSLVSIYEGLKGTWAYDNSFDLVDNRGVLQEPEYGWTVDMLLPYWEKKKSKIDAILKTRDGRTA